MPGAVMGSDDSADESAFTDCPGSGTELRAGPTAARRRQVSVPEMVRRAESRKSKRPAPDRGSKSPRDPALPAAKRPLAEPPGPAGVELSAGALAAIRQLVTDGVAAAMGAFEAKFEQMEKRLSVLESEAMDREIEVRQLSEQLERQAQLNAELQAQVESIDLNRRLASLIFTCDDFGRRTAGEDVEEMMVRLLNDRIPGLHLTIADIHAAHRLQRDDKVIVKFVKRSVRDEIYDARFNMSTRGSGLAGTRLGARGAPGPLGDRRSPLYISESITAYNQRLYNQLLQARKTSGGAKVASVFSRRGLVFCRTVKNGPNIRVPDEATLRRIVGESGSGPSASASGGVGSGAVARSGRAGRWFGAPMSGGRGSGGPPRRSPSAVPTVEAPAAGRPSAGGAVAGAPVAPISGPRDAEVAEPASVERAEPSGEAAAGLSAAAAAEQPAAAPPTSAVAAAPADSPLAASSTGTTGTTSAAASAGTPSVSVTGAPSDAAAGAGASPGAPGAPSDASSESPCGPA